MKTCTLCERELTFTDFPDSSDWCWDCMTEACDKRRAAQQDPRRQAIKRNQEGLEATIPRDAPGMCPNCRQPMEREEDNGRVSWVCRTCERRSVRIPMKKK